MIASHAILDAAECRLVRDRLFELRGAWTSRGVEACPFYTLGAASYIDAAPDADVAGYTEGLGRANPILRGHFGWLHARVMRALSLYLNAEVRTADELALPGFHVWLGQAVPTSPATSIHFDLQYLRLPWPALPRADRSRPISFTLPITLPEAGGGLNVWDLRYGQDAPSPAPEAFARTRAPTFHRYTPGVMASHSGHALHQIAPVSRTRAGDERITLQGHGLACDGVWTIYW